MQKNTPENMKNSDSSGEMRVIIVTEDDPLYVIEFFDVFFEEFPRSDFTIVGVTVVDAFHEPIWKTAWRMFRFYGLVDFVRLGCRFLRAKARGRSIATLAENSGLPLLDTGSVNDPEYIEKIIALKPDVIVSVAAPEIFRREILAVPTLKCINIHSGRLPVYRGMMPNFWQLLHGEQHATITIHEMAEKLDAGGIIATREYPITDRDSLDRVIIGTKRAGARLMIDVLQNYAQDNISVTELDMSNASYFSFPTPKDVRALRKCGHRML